MGITRDQHKRRLTGGKPTHHMKRKHEMGRQMAMTKIGAKRIRDARARRLDQAPRAARRHGQLLVGLEVCTRKTRILDVVYNALTTSSSAPRRS